MHIRTLATALLITLAPMMAAPERLPHEEVDGVALMDEVFFDSPSDTDMTMGWVMQADVFVLCFLGDSGFTPAELAEFRRSLDGKAVLLMCNGTISVFGNMSFADQASVRERLELSVTTTADGDARTLRPSPEVGADLQTLIQVVKPMFDANFGRVGQAIHFYVFDNTDAEGETLIDPYDLDGQITVAVAESDGFPGFESSMPMACNGLFKPRYCANGEPAHVTWRFDPWTGEALPE